MGVNTEPERHQCVICSTLHIFLMYDEFGVVIAWNEILCLAQDDTRNVRPGITMNI